MTATQRLLTGRSSQFCDVPGGALQWLQTIEVTSPVPSVTFSGLDGDNDHIYEIIGIMTTEGDTTTYLYINPNGDGNSANYRGTYQYGYWTNGYGAGQFARMVLGYTEEYTQGGPGFGKSTLYAKRGYGTQDSPGERYNLSHFGTDQLGVQGLIFNTIGFWLNLVDNITSLEIVPSDSIRNIIHHSVFHLYRRLVS